jgi:hypothetical protein
MTIKFDTNPVSLTYPADSHKERESAHRLIVLIPANIDFSAATQRIWGLARTTGMSVQLIGMCEDTVEESRLRRELITMASLLKNGKISAEANVEPGTNWMNAIKTNYAAGDMIICFAEEHTGILHRPLSQILESDFKATVYILSDLAPQKSKSNRLSRMSTWLGILGVIAGFAMLQAKIVQLPEGWLQNTLLILSVIPEFWLIWVWDGWFK